MHCSQGAVDWEGCLGQQRTHRLKHVAALYAAVQVGVDVSDETWLAAEVEQALQKPKKSCVRTCCMLAQFV
jgi:hypothetical protein